MRFTWMVFFLLVPTGQVVARCKTPVISAPTATPDSIGRQVTIAWTTNVPADSLVAYGFDEAGTLTAITDIAGVSTHAVSITGLLPGRRYAFAIRSRAIDSGVACGPQFYAFYGGADSGIYFTTPAAPAGKSDYYIVPIGPHHVTQGYGLYYAIEVGNLVGSSPNNSVRVVLTGLPNNISISWTDPQILGRAGTVATTNITNDTYTFYELRDTEIEVITTTATPPGNYTIIMTVSGAGLPTHVATWPITVDAASSPYGISFPSGAPAFYPAIPNLNRYKVSAMTYGAINCAQDLDASPRTIRPNDIKNLTPVGGAIQKGSWYYDGLRVYYSLSDLLMDIPTWEQCRTNIKQVYRDQYVLPNRGSIPAYVMFAEGYYMDYVRTGDTKDLALIDDLDLHTFGPGNGAMVSVRYLQREVAYDLKIDIFASLLGRNNPRFGHETNYWLSYHLDHVLGHLDQICLSQNAEYWQSFMAGLEADALITYYEMVKADPRIPSAIKCLADYMYIKSYNTITDDQGAFQYDSFRGATNVGIGNARASSTVPLDLLIAPMYAWLFKMTGLAQYQTQGDTIWNHGVLMDGAGGGLPNTIGAPNGPPNGNSGKIFSQQYYWGTKYVTWRSAPGPVSSLQSK